jgi:hypothetical protein
MHLFSLVLLVAAEPVAKNLPPVKEPEWTAWKGVDDTAKQRASAAWAVLRTHRPDREFKTAAERREAERAVDDAYKTLDEKPDAACAVGTEILRGSKDDWERQMVAFTVSHLGGEKGEAFLLWTMATSTAVDESFEPAYDIARGLAARRRPEDLPALFLMLRTRDGRIYLRLHSWYINTDDCLFYVFGRYGRDVIPYLRPMLDHKDPYVRRNAAVLLGYFMDKASTPALIKLLERNDIASGGAAFALGELRAADALRPACRLLSNPDASTRLRAAYALYEIGSKDALPALEAANKLEADQSARGEMTAAIEHIRARAGTPGAGVRKLTGNELRDAIESAKKANGLEGDAESIAVSAGRAELDQLDEIRLKCTDVPSDKGNKSFRRWTAAIREVRRRLD